MLLSDVLGCIYNSRAALAKGLLLVVLSGSTLVSVAGDDESATAEMGQMLSASSLLAREIEAQMVTLQLDIAEGRSATGSQQLTQAMISLYEQRLYRPLWDEPARLEQLIGALDSLADDGLSPEDYRVEQLRQALPLVGDDSVEAVPARIVDELRATNAYLRALYHLYNGKVDPAGLDPQWNFEFQDIAPVADVVRVAEAVEQGQIAQLFEQTRPQHAIYRSFKAGLRHYRELAERGGWPALPVGPTLKPCIVDPQVAMLRQRLTATGEYIAPSETEVRAAVEKCLTPAVSPDASSSDLSINGATSGGEVAEVASSDADSVSSVNSAEVFDEYLVAAVKKFQSEQYLDVDGAIGPATRAALNISVQSRIDQIRVNLDRARWLLHNIPAEMLLVDVAGFKVTYFKANQPIWRSRVQVGMAYRTSPIFKSEVNYITLNPTWTVPPTILRKDILPKVRKNLNYLREHRIRVLDSSGREIDPATVNWNRPSGVTLRQDAGAGAALGKAVIRFPNSHSVYLHDTPHQALFNKSQRAFSSGCIRVERALELVELLLAETPNWDAAAIDKQLATGKTRNVTLAKRVPILLAYWTVDAVSETQVAFKPDIYARDAKVLAALNKRS